MKPILLISLFCLINAKVLMIEPTCDSADCNIHLIEYVQRFDSTTVFKENNDGLMYTISHRQPDLNTAGLYARAFTTTNGEIEITDFTRTDDDSHIYLHAKLSSADVQNIDRCKQIGADDDYEKRECSILIRYYNTTNDQVIKEYAFSLTMRTPELVGFELAASDNRIIEYGCNCVINTRVRFEIKSYREDCKRELQFGSQFNYGEEICFGIFGANEISKTFEYEVVSLTSTYTTPGQSAQSKIIDMLKISSIKHSLNNTSPKGQVYITVPIMFIGNLTFRTTIVIKDLKRVLTDEGEEEKPKGAIVSLPGVFEIDDYSFGSLVAVGLSTLTALLMILL